MSNAKKQSAHRYIVGVAGPPASGKSTLSKKLCTLINNENGNEICDVVPMDGFHLDNTTLDKLQIRHRKGAVNTFDSDGFVSLVKSLQSATKPLPIPLFDRDKDAVIEDAKIIHLKHKILIVEGNYLFLNSEPWLRLQEFFNFKIFINPDIDTIKKRLIDRWLQHGHNHKDAQKRAFSNDIPNAEFVLKNSKDADLII